MRLGHGSAPTAARRRSRLWCGCRPDRGVGGCACGDRLPPGSGMVRLRVRGSASSRLWRGRRFGRVWASAGRGAAAVPAVVWSPARPWRSAAQAGCGLDPAVSRLSVPAMAWLPVRQVVGAVDRRGAATSSPLREPRHDGVGPARPAVTRPSARPWRGSSPILWPPARQGAVRSRPGRGIVPSGPQPGSGVSVKRDGDVVVGPTAVWQSVRLRRGRPERARFRPGRGRPSVWLWCGRRGGPCVALRLAARAPIPWPSAWPQRAAKGARYVALRPTVARTQPGPGPVLGTAVRGRGAGSVPARCGFVAAGARRRPR